MVMGMCGVFRAKIVILGEREGIAYGVRGDDAGGHLYMG